MKKWSLLCFIYLVTLCSALSAQDISGFWKSINEDTKKAESVIAVYPYKGQYYGRIIGTFDANTGKMTDTIYEPKERAPGVVGDPYYCGLDIIWNLKDKGSRYKGKIMDPQEGKVYNAEVWVENGNLIVRGKLFIFGRNQTWPPALDKDFPPDFKKPDLTKLVPVIHEVK